MSDAPQETPTIVGAFDPPTIGASVGGGLGEAHGEKIGPYSLLELIGEGGFGVVWLAERREPMIQRVALKIIKPGMDSKSVIARFERERQALAVMDHPNVARVLDGGVTSSGRPYFVMELVKGEPITDFCDRNQISIADRLSLFADICDAVQHAHLKGIIHRDIKPSNILVSHVEGGAERKLVAKVIDFGIAKAITNSDATERATFTEQGQFVGTPEYMSPEQTGIVGVDVDTRTDIYSLGVTLYELLSGLLPFDSETLRSGGFVEMQSIIREADPPRPSTKLSRARSDTRKLIALSRCESVESIERRLRRELEWIPLKAMRKERAERYQTPGILADDIRRYLRGEALLAGPESKAYRARKFVRRYRGQVAAAGAIFTALAVGIAVAISQRDRALASEAEARANSHRAEANAKAEAAARARSEAVIEFVISTLQSADPERTGGSQVMTVLEAMEVAVEQLETGRFRDEPAIELRLRSTIGTILESNGRAVEAESMFAQALATARTIHRGDHPEVMQMIAGVASARHAMGDVTESLRLYREAIDMSTRLYPDPHPEVAKLWNNLAFVTRASGDLAEAEGIFERVLSMWRSFEGAEPVNVAVALDNLASVRRQLGRASEAEPLLTEALSIRRSKHGADHPDVARSMNNLALVLRQLKRFEEAESILVEVVAMTERLYPKGHPDVASALHSLASARHSLGHAEDAETLYRRALAMRRELIGPEHPDVASTLNNLAKVLLEDERFGEAESCYSESLRIFKARHEGDHPLVATALNNLGTVKAKSGELREAVKYFEQAVAMGELVYPPDHPDLRKFKAGLEYCNEQLQQTPAPE